MKRHTFRLFLLAALLVSLLVRYQWVHDRNTQLSEFDISAAIEKLVRRNDLVLRENPVRPPKVLSSIVYFERPGCDRVSFAMPFALTFDAKTMFARLNKPDYVTRVHYLDQSWERQERTSMFILWIRYNALAAFGASQFVPMGYGLMVADPPECAGAESLVWESVWMRSDQMKELDLDQGITRNLSQG